MSARVSIIIPAFNQLHFCRQCLTTLLDNTDGDYKLILVDNGSTDGVSEFFDSVPGATVVHSPENVGFAAGINLGLQHAEGHALLLNSDTLLPRNWLGRMVSALESEDSIGMVGPRSNCVSGSQQIDGLAFDHIDAINAYADTLYQEHRGQLRDVARLVGFCLLIRDTVWQSVGGMDESFGIGNYEDDDYCMRVLRAGHRLCVAEDCFVFHYGSRTFLGMGIENERWQELLDTNEQVFASKWQAAPEDRSDAIQQARQLLRQARDLMGANDGVGALRKCTEAQALAPGYDQVYNDLGAVLWSMDMFEDALKNFTRALELNPDSIEADENLAAARAALGSSSQLQ